MANAGKEKLVEDLTSELKKSEHVLVTHYQGLSSDEMSQLRNKLAELGAKYKVVKNRLANIALKKVGWDLEASLKGPSALAYQGKDIAAVAKVLDQVSIKNKKFKIIAGHFFGKAADAGMIQSIATLPSREVLLATLAARLNGPLQSLVATLSEPMRALHAALGAFAKKKESAPAG